jgi:hypothetical protein
MGVNASRVKYLKDVAAAVTLRNVADGAEAPSGASVWETAVSLGELNTAYWHGDEIPHGTFVVEVNVTAINVSTNVYHIELRVDDVLAQNDTPVVIASMPVKATGVYHFVIDSKDIPQLDPETSSQGKFIAIGVTESGTPDAPSITYGAYMAKVVAP